MSPIETLDAVRVLLEQARKNLDDLAREKAKPAFLAVVESLFDDPKLEEFKWHQHTPYFNDGDPCIFHVIPYADVTYDKEYYDCVDNRKLYNHLTGKYYQGPEVFDTIGTCLKFLDANRDMAELAFGDPVEVTVRRGGEGEDPVVIETAEYEPY